MKQGSSDVLRLLPRVRFSRGQLLLCVLLLFFGCLGSLEARLGGGRSYSSSRSRSSSSYSSSRSRSYSSSPSRSRSYSSSSNSYSSRSYSSRSYSSGFDTSILDSSAPSYDPSLDFSFGFSFEEVLFFWLPLLGVLIYAKFGEDLGEVVQDQLSRISWPSSRPPEADPAPLRKPSSEPMVRKAHALDPNFSRVAFLDFVSAAYHAVHHARGTKQFGALDPYLTPGLASRIHQGTAFKQYGPAPDSVEDIVVGSIQIVDFRVRSEQSIQVELFTNFSEVLGGERRDFFLVEEMQFVRPLRSMSPAPEKTQSLGCPSCGAPVELTPEGLCTFCQEPVGRQPFGWQLSSLRFVERSPRVELRPEWSDGGKEVGYDHPTRKSSEGLKNYRELQARDQAFSQKGFEAFAKEVFLNLQDAWSQADLARLRPFETDRLYDSHRFWIERYRERGIRNQLEEIQILKIDWSRIEIDAFFEAVTLRIFASMLDSDVELPTGRVVGGNSSKPRLFSEYWTFLRSTTAPKGHAATARSCPSCGAPLEKINQAGICEHCDAKIVTGNFSWVLAWIEQDEDYVL